MKLATMGKRRGSRYSRSADCRWFLTRMGPLTGLLVCGVVSALLMSCSGSLPELTTLYKTSQQSGEQFPVILVHGAFGGRLCAVDGSEHWPGSLVDILFDDYQSLALPIADSPYLEAAVPLHVCGLTDKIAGRDFYGDIEATLTGPGGYQLTQPGQAVAGDHRRYYRFLYDWRQDNSQSAAALDGLVEQIREDHGDPRLRVDVVAHSMGGLVTRYWLRYGDVDVLGDNEFPINNRGAQKVRKIILVGTPSLGSTSALQQLLTGADLGVNKIAPEVLLTFPGSYQLLPHPIVDSVFSANGSVLDRDIFDIELWRALQWGPFDPGLRSRLLARGWSGQSILALEEYVGVQLERARRFVWSLTVSNPGSGYQLIVFGGDCVATPARIIIEDIGDDSYVRLWPAEIKQPDSALDYPAVMLEPGDGAVTKASLLARTELDPSVPRHRYSDFPIDYSMMFCEDHSQLTGNITFQDNLLHILLSR